MSENDTIKPTTLNANSKKAKHFKNTCAEVSMIHPNAYKNKYKDTTRVWRWSYTVSLPDMHVCSVELYKQINKEGRKVYMNAKYERMKCFVNA